MLRADQRLKKNSQFAEVFAKGKKVRTAHLLLVTAPNSLAHARIGIIVSKKVSQKAVTRNRLRRIIAHVAREKWSKLDQKPARDIVLALLSVPSKQIKESISKEVEECLAKL